MKRIYNQQLKEYCSRDYYPWHMPGHKRNNMCQNPLNMAYDVTEVPGLDDLHVPEGCLADSMEQLKEVYGSAASYYLVNGSTCGILTAISAVCQRGDSIIMGRHCHKSVYHAAALLELRPIYIYPKVIEPWNINGGVTAVQIEEALKQHPEAKAVIFPSPTYEGIVSDIKTISRIVHRAGAFLIIDEAHGAHLEFGSQKILPAIRCDADLVIESLHKTLPCYTQCAILHIGKYATNIRPNIQNLVERYLNVYETSSPSYLFVAAMENCIATMEEWRNTRMKDYLERLSKYRKKWEQLHFIHLLTAFDVKSTGSYEYDETKLIFSHCNMNGEAFQKILERKFGLVVEMASLNYILALSTVMDSEDAFIRLDSALRELDKINDGMIKNEQRSIRSQENLQLNSGIKITVIRNSQEMDFHQKSKGIASGQITEYKMSPGIAWNLETENVPISQAEGRIAGDYITVYPPGIPICVPGEIVTRQALDYLNKCYQEKLTIHGIIKEQSE